MTGSDQPTAPRILLLIKDQKMELYCHDHLKERGIVPFSAHDMRELVATMEGKSVFHGVIVDIRFSMKADAELKHLLRRLENIYPFLRIKQDADGTLHGMSSLAGSVTLDDFLGQCRSFPARPLREEERREQHISAWLSATPEFADAEASVSINLSCRGAFFYSARTWEIGATIWVRYPGCSQETTFVAKVCWCRPWGGKSDGLPGIGVEFQHVSAEQCALLMQFLEGDDPSR